MGKYRGTGDCIWAVFPLYLNRFTGFGPVIEGQTKELAERYAQEFYESDVKGGRI